MTTSVFKLQTDFKFNLKVIGILLFIPFVFLSSCANSRTPEQLTDALFTAISKNDCDKVKHLLEKGADPNGKDHPSSMLPLRNAAVNGQVDCVKYLLEAGADPTAEVRIKSGGTVMVMRTLISVQSGLLLLQRAKLNPSNVDPNIQELIDSGVTTEKLEEIILMLKEAENQNKKSE